MNTQETSDQFPYLEFGDLAHRLIYQETAMLTAEEHEFIKEPVTRDPNDLESLEFGRVILGLRTNLGSSTNIKLENALLDKLNRDTVPYE